MKTYWDTIVVSAIVLPVIWPHGWLEQAVGFWGMALIAPIICLAAILGINAMERYFLRGFGASSSLMRKRDASAPAVLGRE